MNKFLLPYCWKRAGIILVSIGMVLSACYFWLDFRFKIPVFAIYSAFLETKMFVVFRTNFADELILLVLLAGLGIWVFSREKIETGDMDSRRTTAFAKAGIANIVFLFASILFVYGSGFIVMLVANIFTFYIFYLIFFHIRKRSE